MMYHFWLNIQGCANETRGHPGRNAWRFKIREQKNVWEAGTDTNTWKLPSEKLWLNPSELSWRCYKEENATEGRNMNYAKRKTIGGEGNYEQSRRYPIEHNTKEDKRREETELAIVVWEEGYRQIKNCPSDLPKEMDTQTNGNCPTYFIRSEPVGTTDVQNILTKTVKEPTKINNI